MTTTPSAATKPKTTTRGLVAALILVAACGGSDSDPNAPDQLVSCAAGWETKYSGLPLSGQCAMDCRTAPVAKVAASCKIDATINGTPSKVECDGAEIGEFGTKVDLGGEVVCCWPANNGAAWDVTVKQCE